MSYFDQLGSNPFVRTKNNQQTLQFSETMSTLYTLSLEPQLGIWPKQYHPVEVEDQTWNAETNSFASEISTPFSPPLSDFSCTWLRHGGSETCPALGSELGLLHGVWHSTLGIWPCLWVPKEVLKFGMTQSGTSSS